MITSILPPTSFNGPFLVADYGNSMLHFFNKNDGYLGSFQSTENNLKQWMTLKTLSSSIKSFSHGDFIDFVTLDCWDQTWGINTYLPGVDFSPPVEKTGFIGNIIPYYSLSSTLLNNSIFSIEIFKDDQFVSSMNYNLPSGKGTIASVIPDSSGSIGVYKIHLTARPEYYSSYLPQYSDFKKEFIKAFAFPMKAVLSGPDKGIVTNSMTWVANVSSGSGDFIYSWSIKPDGSDNWHNLQNGKSNSLTIAMESKSFMLQCTIIDLFNLKGIVCEKRVEKL